MFLVSACALGNTPQEANNWILQPLDPTLIADNDTEVTFQWFKSRRRSQVESVIPMVRENLSRKIKEILFKGYGE